MQKRMAEQNNVPSTMPPPETSVEFIAELIVYPLVWSWAIVLIDHDKHGVRQVLAICISLKVLSKKSRTAAS